MEGNVVADKLTQTILDGLTRAASASEGMPLVAARNESGLFPATALGRSAAQKCQVDGFLTVVRTENRGKSTCDFFTLTDTGWEYLLGHVNPKHVLEDFVRVLESRQGEVHGLMEIARRMADNLEGLKDAVGRVLPQIETATIRRANPEPVVPERERVGSYAHDLAYGAVDEPRNGTHAMNGTAMLEVTVAELSGAILARLADWASSAGASEDCPLPELFRSLGTREPAPTVGEFHDCLRSLHSRGKLYLHPWTGPLYTLPEPTYALLVGHNIAYYASIR